MNIVTSKIWIDKHSLYIGEFISLLNEKDFIITDNKYNIPDTLTHISDENLQTLGSFGLLNIYGVADAAGHIHINENDVNHIKNWLSKLEGRDLRYAKQKSINVIAIDYKTPEENKKFFSEVLK